MNDFMTKPGKEDATPEILIFFLFRWDKIDRGHLHLVGAGRGHSNSSALWCPLNRLSNHSTKVFEINPADSRLSKNLNKKLLCGTICQIF